MSFLAAADDNLIAKTSNFRMKKLVMVIVSLPLIAFVLCVLISLIKDFEEVNKTHCKVYNFLPSVSSAIGNNSPQTYIWRLAVAFHLSPRILFALTYYGCYKDLDHSWRYNTTYRVLCRGNLGLHLAEILCLAGLTFVSSSENYSIHEKSFIGFAICSWLYMFTTIAVSRFHRDKQFSTGRLKRVILCVFCMSILGISYTYWRHNAFCEPYVYSIFAFFEYLTILCNMAFHAQAAWDFEDYCFIVTTQKNHEQQQSLL